jgi:hypothetical protein
VKSSILALLAFLSLSESVLADRGEEHYKEICETEEVKSLVGAKGLCTIVLSPSTKVLKGTCHGILLGQIPCVISYDTASSNGTTGMSIICGDEKKPILNQKLEILAKVYEAKGIVRSTEGKFSVKKDNAVHAIIQSVLVEMKVSETTESKEASIVFTIRDTPNSMTNVVCE